MTDQVSQQRIYADLSGAGGRSILLQQVKSIDIKDGQSTEVTVAIGGFKGFRHKVGGFEIDLNCYREVGDNPEVDWRGLRRVKRTFTLTTQDEDGGLRESFTCRVSKVDRKGDEAGVHEDTVTLVATYANDGILSTLQ